MRLATFIEQGFIVFQKANSCFETNKFLLFQTDKNVYIFVHLCHVSYNRTRDEYVCGVGVLVTVRGFKFYAAAHKVTESVKSVWPSFQERIHLNLKRIVGCFVTLFVGVNHNSNVEPFKVVFDTTFDSSHATHLVSPVRVF
jgi:hypothetical protein